MIEHILIRKIHMECPLCDKTHELEERKRTTVTVIKNEEVEYDECFYFCMNADEDENEFETGEMLNKNLLNARNAYRKKMGLLTSYEIVKIRENYGLSQVDLARLLGWGEVTISRYESKAIQDEAYDTMLRLIKDNPLKALEFLKRNSAKFSTDRILAIRQCILDKLDSYGKEFLTRQTFECEYVIFDEPSDSNGYTVLDIDKLETVVSYLAKYMTDFYKIKLMKSLWYVDALSYIQTGRAMTGLVYRHESIGALPIGHYNLLNLENINVKEEINCDYDSMLHIYPSENVDYTILSNEEKMIIETVVNKFENFKVSDMVECMKKERAYKETLEGEIIPFSRAKGLEIINMVGAEN